MKNPLLLIAFLGALLFLGTPLAQAQTFTGSWRPGALNRFCIETRPNCTAKTINFHHGFAMVRILHDVKSDKEPLRVSAAIKGLHKEVVGETTYQLLVLIKDKNGFVHGVLPMKSLRVQPRKNALSQPRKRFRKRLVRGKFLPQPSHIQQYKKWVRQGERFTPVLFAIYKDQPYLDGLDEKHVKTLQEHLKGNLNTKELLSGLNKGKTRIP